MKGGIFKMDLENFKRYLKRKDCAESTIVAYVKAVKLFHKVIEKRPEEIELEDVEDFRVYLKDSYSHNSLVNKLAGINRYMDFLKKDIKIKVPTGIYTKQDDVLKWLEIEKMFEVCKYNLFQQAVLKVLAYTGIRRSELIALNEENINWKEKQIMVWEQKTKQFMPKPITQDVMATLKEYLDYKHLKLKPRRGHEKTLFLTNRRVRPCDSTINTLVAEAGVMAGIKRKVHPHIFRASFSTKCAEAGMTPFEIKHLTGHKSISSLERYVRPDAKRINAMYKDIFEKQEPLKKPESEIKKSEPENSKIIPDDEYKKFLEWKKQQESMKGYS